MHPCLLRPLNRLRKLELRARHGELDLSPLVGLQDLTADPDAVDWVLLNDNQITRLQSLCQLAPAEAICSRMLSVLPQLKSLTLCWPVSGPKFFRLLSSCCPLLEELILTADSLGQQLDIASVNALPKLKDLWLNTAFRRGIDSDPQTILLALEPRIWFPLPAVDA